MKRAGQCKVAAVGVGDAREAGIIPSWRLLGSVEQHWHLEPLGDLGCRALVPKIQRTYDQPVHLLPGKVIRHRLGLVEGVNRPVRRQPAFCIYG